MFKIQTLNPISTIGLKQFPQDLYQVSAELQRPDAIIVRSHDMHNMLLPSTVKIVGRAGAGLNNIPVSQLTKRGIPVLNTPGANANAVCELVIAGMLLASRNICRAWQYVKELKLPDAELTKTIEKNKKNFVGFEISTKKLGIIGLGNVGVRVANAAIGLGMEVVGYDPAITVNRAWELSANVRQAHTIDELLSEVDMISLHVPLIAETRNMLNVNRLQNIKPGAILLNFARDGIIDHTALLDALEHGKVQTYVTDFPNNLLKDHPNVINLPHLGASTLEAEENCAEMIVRQMRAFLETGSISHSVNFPNVDLPAGQFTMRLLISNENIPNMVAQISSKLAAAGINIQALLNKSKADIAYTVIDVQNLISDELLNEISAVTGILQLRTITPTTAAVKAANYEQTN